MGARPTDTDLVPLQWAARLAHQKLFARTILSSDDAFDVIASTLARRLPVFGVPEAGQELVEITRLELGAGTFSGGGARLECRDTTFVRLAVDRRDLDRLLQSWT